VDQATELLLNEYEQKLDVFARLENTVALELHRLMDEGGMGDLVIDHRIKTPESIKTKMDRKARKYHSIDEITDVVGFRVVCYFSDQVDAAASIIADAFDVDEERSCDKRSLIAPTTFGYLSLHYICSLPSGKGFPEDLCGVAFEVQIRTMLQHTWAEIEHDLGYKSELAVPYEVRRDFARVASLLEIADGYFMNIRTRLSTYESEVRENIRNDNADSMTLNRVTLEEFIRSSDKMIDLNNEIAAISGATITEVSPEACLTMLQFFAINTIKELKTFIEKEAEHAISLASIVLRDSEIDELISTVGLYYLFRAELIYGDYNYSDMYRFCSLVDSNKDRIAKKAERILTQQQSIRNLPDGQR